jgi:hypothetical protein
LFSVISGGTPALPHLLVNIGSQHVGMVHILICAGDQLQHSIGVSIFWLACTLFLAVTYIHNNIQCKGDAEMQRCRGAEEVVEAE